MWTYSISSSTLTDQFGSDVGSGYSGNGVWKNQDGATEVRNHGPIPEGIYTIGEPVDSAQLGPLAIPLIPNAANQMYDRSGFYCHGDSLAHPGDASDGCIILPHPVRQELAESTDRELQVIA